MAEDAWRAVDRTFAQQQSNGGFGYTNRSGTPGAPKDDYSDAAFWLAQFDQAALVVRASPLAADFGARVDALLPKVRAAGAFVVAGKETLAARDAPAPNRLFIDALACSLTGLLTGDRDLVATGAWFVDLALRKQAPEGYFDEHGGADTSYNNVSILMMQVYDLYLPSPAVSAALARAVRWELPHVLPSGEIDVSGNSRTGLGQESYFGKAKDVNYGEAVLGLGYYGIERPDEDARQAAERAFAFHFGGESRGKSRGKNGDQGASGLPTSTLKSD
jgi:hypothetical protein